MGRQVMRSNSGYDGTDGFELSHKLYYSLPGLNESTGAVETASEKKDKKKMGLRGSDHDSQKSSITSKVQLLLFISLLH